MKDVYFDVSNTFTLLAESGAQTSVAVNSDDLAVEIHKSERKDDLYYHLGRVDGPYVNWGSSSLVGRGITPVVALNNNKLAVELHESPDRKNTLAYRIGTIKDNEVRWDKETDYDNSGHRPAVAIHENGRLVGLQESNPRGSLFFRVGSVQGSTISHWGQNDKESLAAGTAPAVAMNNAGYVVAIYSNADPVPELCYQVGIIDGLTIKWGGETQYDTGLDPAVALTNDGLVIEAHRTRDTNDIVYRVGTLDTAGKTIAFGPGGRIANTISPIGGKPNHVSLATNGDLALETYSTVNNILGFASSLLINSATWMSDSLPTLGAKTLKEICLPGSHDCTTYTIVDCKGLGGDCNSRTQRNTIFEQLQSGIRYFDIRPVFYNNALTTGHFGDAIFTIDGCNAAPLTEVLAHVKKFMDTGVREAVILKFSHYYDRDNSANKFGFTPGRIITLLEMVREALKDYLYVKPPNRRLVDIALNDLIGTRGIVLPVLEEVPFGSLVRGTYRYLDLPKNSTTPFDLSDLLVYDRFTDTNDLPDMILDQVGKLGSAANHRGDLFLFSYTLTQRTIDAATCSDSNPLTTIVHLAKGAGASLPRTIVRAYNAEEITEKSTPYLIPNIIYVDLASDFATNVAVWLNRRLNRGDSLFSQNSDYLIPGDSIYSSSRATRLTYQKNGDLVFFDKRGTGHSISRTAGQATWRCIMQGDGNFVVYKAPYQAIFASNTMGTSGANLKVQNDDKVIVYDQAGIARKILYPPT